MKRNLAVYLSVSAVILPVVLHPGVAHADPRTVSISNAQVTEGDSGIKTAHFKIELSEPHTHRVVVHFKTKNRSAKADKDYQPREGRRIFNPGRTKIRVSVRVIGDEMDERDESFVVRLYGIRHARSGDNSGRGTIEDDDNPPTLSILDDSTSEGGATTMPVRLSRRSGKRITFDYATSDGTADANFDYSPEDSTLTFQPGDKQVVVTIDTINDGLDESDETFMVNLSNVIHATANDGEGTGTILDND